MAIAGKRILIVEKDEMVSEMLKDILPKMMPDTTEIIFAENGGEAFRFFDQTNRCPFDLVVTAVTIPVIDGIELIVLLKELYPEMPIILMSGSGNPATHRADLFIPKPFYVGKLKAAIDTLLKN